MLKQCLFYVLCTRVLPSRDTQISIRCVNVVRSCMSELTFHLLQPQLQISFTDDLRRENASRMYIYSARICHGIYLPSPCLASTLSSVLFLIISPYVKLSWRMTNGTSERRKSSVLTTI